MSEQPIASDGLRILARIIASVVLADDVPSLDARKDTDLFGDLGCPVSALSSLSADGSQLRKEEDSNEPVSMQ